MLEFKHITKTYPLEHGKRKVIFQNISFSFPEGKNIALLGANGAGKSTTLRLIAGSDFPDSGEIIRKGRLSWPLGFSGGFHQSLTGEENLRFICRIYGADLKKVKAYVEEFVELGEYLYQPIKTYSSGMRARLAFGLSLAIRFDIYLIDELTAVGDANFKKKSKEAFKQLHKTSNIIMTSHSMPTLREYCDIAVLLEDGHMHIFENLNEGIAAYEKNGGADEKTAVEKVKKNKAPSISSKEDLGLIKNLQFHYIKERLKIFQKKDLPVVFVDSRFNRRVKTSDAGEQNQPLDNASQFDVDVFLANQKGDVDIFGNYELARDKGWVSSGISLNTIQFAVSSIRSWWFDIEANPYQNAKEIYIVYLSAGQDELKETVMNKWNAELQKLADELKVTFYISLVPQGNTRWVSAKSKIFNFNVRGLQELAIVVSLMGKVEQGCKIKIRAKVDNTEYNKNIEETNFINLEPEEFCGKWNYKLHPNSDF